jgi:2-dehydro-3-deoxyphosphogluconate aldolase/(4S)-4-hydroxy-2-oxoglutarate aldolase
MNKNETLNAIKSSGVVIILRLPDTQKTLQAAIAVSKGDIRCIEIPMTVPDATSVIRDLCADKSLDIVVGAGTVLEVEDAQAAIDAGAEYIVSPHTDFEIIEVCKQRQKVSIPGAFTPTEIYKAWKAGADIVKIFSTRTVGPTYLSDLKGPFPKIEFIPSGGVSIDNAADFIRAGACAVTVGRDVADTKAIDRGDLDLITENARRLVANVARVKQSK